MTTAGTADAKPATKRPTQTHAAVAPVADGDDDEEEEEGEACGMDELGARPVSRQAALKAMQATKYGVRRPISSDSAGVTRPPNA